jgi:hypothetical protein
VGGALLIAAAIELAGCNGVIATRPEGVHEARYFELVIPPVGSGGAVPGQVSDLTATIVGVEVGRKDPLVGAVDQPFVAPQPGRPDAIVVGWVGGNCDARVDLELSPGEGGAPTITLKLLARPGACDSVGVPRRVILTFDHPVNAAGYRLDVVR